MNEIEKVQELQKCSDRHRAIHDRRQKNEYRVVITVLTFYAGATWAILKNDPTILHLAIIIPISVGYLLLAIFTSVFLKRLHLANQVNITISENYETEIIRLLELNKNPMPMSFQKTDYNEIQSLRFPLSNWGWQTIIVFCFSLTALVLLWAK